MLQSRSKFLASTCMFPVHYSVQNVKTCNSIKEKYSPDYSNESHNLHDLFMFQLLGAIPGKLIFGSYKGVAHNFKFVISKVKLFLFFF